MRFLPGSLRLTRSSSLWMSTLRWGRIMGYGRQGIGQANSNGMGLLALCSEHNLTSTNIIFQQKNKNRPSWMHPRSKHWHLIVIVIVRRCDITVLITQSMRNAECWTDHRMIMAKVCITVCPLLQKHGPSERRLDCARHQHKKMSLMLSG